MEPVKTGPMEHRTVGVRLLPYCDDFLLFAKGLEQTKVERDFVQRTLDSMGLQRKLEKGVWEGRRSAWSTSA